MAIAAAPYLHPRLVHQAVFDLQSRDCCTACKVLPIRLGFGCYWVGLGRCMPTTRRGRGCSPTCTRAMWRSAENPLMGSGGPLDKSIRAR
jgi:hypothetical protein